MLRAILEPGCAPPLWSAPAWAEGQTVWQNAMTDHEKRPSLEDVEARLAVVRAQQEQKQATSARRRTSGAAQSVGFKIAAELVASILVGAGLGYLIDQWLETKPVFLVVMIFLGFAAALMNVYRILKGLDQAVGLGRAVREANDKRATPEDEQKP